jgi:hypothetical protein
MLRLGLTINGAWETGALEEADGSFCHGLPSVCYAGVTARGCRLVKVEPRDTKSSEPRPKRNEYSSNRIPLGFLFATDLNRKKRFIQTRFSISFLAGIESALHQSSRHSDRPPPNRRALKFN